MKKELREKQGKEMTLDDALERNEKLEGYLDEYKLAFQAMVDREMPPEEKDEALFNASKRIQILNERLNAKDKELRSAERNLKLIVIRRNKERRDDAKKGIRR